MRQVADNLRRQVYIDSGNVEAIRQYIRVKYPGCDDGELGAIFADALHKVIDARIYQFEEKHRKRIKSEVISKAVCKKQFSIDAAEVFSSCLSLKLHDEGYIESLTQWINQSQPAPVSAGEVDRLLSKAQLLDGEFQENQLDRIIDAYEESLSEEEATETADKAFDGHEPFVDSQEATWIEQVEAKQPFRLSMRLAAAAAIPLTIIAAIAVSGLSGEKVRELRFKGAGRYALIDMEQMDRYFTLESRMLAKLGETAGVKSLIVHDGLHEDYRYEAVDKEKLRKWLENRKSILSEEPYFTAIIETSRRYDIHPVLMFAVVGQEQGFVPKNAAAARRIANNPFNVYGSWEKYNTDIYDSSSLAADTIIKSSRNRPAYINTIKWINRRYAEDPNWWNGVSSLFAQIKKEMINF